jgi:hypothetical protein
MSRAPPLGASPVASPVFSMRLHRPVMVSLSLLFAASTVGASLVPPTSGCSSTTRSSHAGRNQLAEQLPNRITALARLATAVTAIPVAAASGFGAPSSAFALDKQFGYAGGALGDDVGQSIKGGGVEILMTDLSYKELKSCPEGFFLPTKAGPWNCIEITATANNQGKREPSAAAVYGQVRDAEGFPCSAVSLDPSQKTEIGSLGKVPKGESKVSFTVAVQARSPRPFSLTGFKASYRSAKLENMYKTFDPCEIDSSKCDDFEDQPQNAKDGYSKTGLFGAQY